MPSNQSDTEIQRTLQQSLGRLFVPRLNASEEQVREYLRRQQAAVMRLRDAGFVSDASAIQAVAGVSGAVGTVALNNGSIVHLPTGRVLPAQLPPAPSAEQIRNTQSLIAETGETIQRPASEIAQSDTREPAVGVGNTLPPITWIREPDAPEPTFGELLGESEELTNAPEYGRSPLADAVWSSFLAADYATHMRAAEAAINNYTRRSVLADLGARGAMPPEPPIPVDLARDAIRRRVDRMLNGELPIRQFDAEELEVLREMYPSDWQAVLAFAGLGDQIPPQERASLEMLGPPVEPEENPEAAEIPEGYSLSAESDELPSASEIYDQADVLDEHPSWGSLSEAARSLLGQQVFNVQGTQTYRVSSNTSPFEEVRRGSPREDRLAALQRGGQPEPAYTTSELMATGMGLSAAAAAQQRARGVAAEQERPAVSSGRVLSSAEEAAIREGMQRSEPAGVPAPTPWNAQNWSTFYGYDSGPYRRPADRVAYQEAINQRTARPQTASLRENQLDLFVSDGILFNAAVEVVLGMIMCGHIPEQASILHSNWREPDAVTGVHILTRNGNSFRTNIVIQFAQPSPPAAALAVFDDLVHQIQFNQRADPSIRTLNMQAWAREAQLSRRPRQQEPAQAAVALQPETMAAGRRQRRIDAAIEEADNDG